MLNHSFQTALEQERTALWHCTCPSNGSTSLHRKFIGHVICLIERFSWHLGWLRRFQTWSAKDCWFILNRRERQKIKNDSCAVQTIHILFNSDSPCRVQSNFPTHTPSSTYTLLDVLSLNVLSCHHHLS